MREKQAEQKGYWFTGHYNKNKEIIKDKAKEFRKNGYKAVVCESEGGYSVYAEQKYFIDKEIQDINKHLNNIESRKLYALEKYNKEIEEIEKDKREMEERLKELIESLQ